MEINLKPNEGSLPKNAVKVLPRDRRRTSTGATNPGQDDAFPGLEDQQNTSKSFLARYWYIFLPMFIMSLFGEAPEDENASRQGQGQGQTQAQGQSQSQGRAAVNASSGASSAAGRPSGGVKQRRGKRG